MSRNNDHNNGIGLGILGLVVGGILGVLFAPKKGEKTREDVHEFIDDTVTKGRKTIGAEVDDFVDELKTRWDRIKEEWNGE